MTLWSSFSFIDHKAGRWKIKGPNIENLFRVSVNFTLIWLQKLFNYLINSTANYHDLNSLWIWCFFLASTMNKKKLFFMLCYTHTHTLVAFDFLTIFFLSLWVFFSYFLQRVFFYIQSTFTNPKTKLRSKRNWSSFACNRNGWVGGKKRKKCFG